MERVLWWGSVMPFLLSHCIGLVTPDPGAAAQFYAGQFDMTDLAAECGVQLDAGPLEMFIDPGHTRPLVFELLTDDLGEARARVRKFGFEELVWRGAGQSCLLRDPFGLTFNIHEDRSAFLPFGLGEPTTGFVKNCIGALIPAPVEAAEFYATVLETSWARLPDGSSIVDSGSMRMRFKFGISTTPVIWMKRDAPVDRLVAAGCRASEDAVVVDPFGVHWCLETAHCASRAVVSPL